MTKSKLHIMAEYIDRLYTKSRFIIAEREGYMYREGGKGVKRITW